MSRPFATVEEAIEEIRAGRMVVVCDDEDRENEGDLTMAAQFGGTRSDTSHTPRRELSIDTLRRYGFVR